jgi:hypothetical protein
LKRVEHAEFHRLPSVAAARAKFTDEAR